MNNNELFIQPVEFTKVSYRRVSENPAEWTGNIMEAFYSQFPYFANAPVTVTLTEKDEARGYALGTIKITEGTGMVVPVIIQSRELFPFDVCIVEGRIMPLTNTTLNLYVQSRGAFLRVVKPDAGDPTNALFNISFSQNITPTYISDQYKTADAHVPETDAMGKKPEQGATTECPICKKHVCQCPPSQTAKVQVTSTDAMGKKAAVEKDAALFQKFVELMRKQAESEKIKEKKEEKKELEPNERKEEKQEKKAFILDKIAGTITQTMKDSFFAELDKNASIIEGFRRNGTHGLIEKLALVKPTTVDFNDKVRKELDRDIHYIYKAAAHEYKGIFSNSHVADPVEINIDEVVATKMEAVRTPATDLVKMADTSTPSVYMRTSEGLIALLDDGTYVELPPHTSMLMEKTANIVGHLWEHRLSEPCITKCAMWFNYPTNPFEITRVWVDGTKERIETWDGLNKVSYVRMQGIDTPVVEHGVVYMPKNAQVVLLGNKVVLPERALPDPTLTDEVICLNKNAYVLKGNTFDQYLPSVGKEYDLHKTSWHVLQCGGTKTDLEKIAALAPGTAYKLGHALTVPMPFEKVAQKQRDEYEVKVQRIQKGILGKEWTKLASVITDTPSVDAVLSLNFVNRDNIAEFANSLPLFQDVSQTLAEMLLKSRIGVRVVDENVLRRVMLGVVDIIDVLAGVANLAGNK